MGHALVDDGFTVVSRLALAGRLRGSGYHPLTVLVVLAAARMRISAAARMLVSAFTKLERRGKAVSLSMAAEYLFLPFGGTNPFSYPR